jgi:hypothetical protein
MKMDLTFAMEASTSIVTPAPAGQINWPAGGVYLR